MLKLIPKQFENISQNTTNFQMLAPTLEPVARGSVFFATCFSEPLGGGETLNKLWALLVPLFGLSFLIFRMNFRAILFQMSKIPRQKFDTS